MINKTELINFLVECETCGNMAHLDGDDEADYNKSIKLINDHVKRTHHSIVIRKIYFETITTIALPSP